jgi:hypothetical protein
MLIAIPSRHRAIVYALSLSIETRSRGYYIKGRSCPTKGSTCLAVSLLAFNSYS